MGVSPSPLGEGSRERNNFFLGGREFWGQNGAFSCTLGAKFRFFYGQNSIEIHQEYKGSMEIVLHAIKSVTQGYLSL